MSVSPHENLWKNSRHTCRQGKQTADRTKNFTSFSPRYSLNVGIWISRIFFYQIKLYIFFLWMNSILWFCISLWIFMHTDFFSEKKNGLWGKGFKEISVHFIRLNKLCADLRILIAKKNKRQKMSQLQRERKFFCISILPVNYSITKMNSN